MKRTSPALLLCIVSLIACGQTPTLAPSSSKPASIQVTAIDTKSLFYQHTAPDSAIFMPAVA
jgi:hypothetical protein